jgi:acyl dehydratase
MTADRKARDCYPAGGAGAAARPDAQGGRRAPMAGLWFEEFEEGRTYVHPITRTVTETDNMLFSCLTMNPQPLHIDRHFAAGTEWGEPLMNSLFTLGLMIGISVNDLTVGTTIANLGMREVKFPAPLFQGDTVRVETTVVSKRESRSRADAGVVELDHRAYKQDGTLVAQCIRQAFMRKRPA